MELSTFISLILALGLILAIILYKLIVKMREYFEIGQNRDVHSSMEIFRSLFQDRDARYEESRRFEWVHLSEYNRSRQENLPPIYP
ncbi:unnamed protein product [Caenorhabditis brenneri]